MAEDRVAFKAVIIGGSAGSLEVILRLVTSFPDDAGLIFILVLHRKNEPDSVLTELIAARTLLTVKEAEDKDAARANTIYIAPPDYHLLVEADLTLALDSSEKLHFSRPSIDVCFESAADIFGPSLIGILLSGANADGAAGLEYIRRCGGHTIVQHPASAEVNYMPLQAIKRCAAHEVTYAENINTRLMELINTGNKIPFEKVKDENYL